MTMTYTEFAETPFEAGPAVNKQLLRNAKAILKDLEGAVEIALLINAESKETLIARVRQDVEAHLEFANQTEERVAKAKDIIKFLESAKLRLAVALANIIPEEGAA